MDHLPVDETLHILLQLGQFELLPMRAVSSHWRDMVTATIREHDECRSAVFALGSMNPLPTVSARCIEARGRAFGIGCQRFVCRGSKDYVKAMMSFAANTVSLTELDVSFSGVNNIQLVAMCSHAPLLIKLRAFDCEQLEVLIEATGKTRSLWLPVRQPNLAANISEACHFLEEVELPTPRGAVDGSRLISSAETYARHFPRLSKLRLCSGFHAGFLSYEVHVPTILSTLLCCPAVTELDADYCVLPGKALLQITSPLAARLVSLKMEETRVAASTIIQCVATCPLLRELRLPETLDDAADYLALTKACPTITRLYLTIVDDAGLAVVFSNLDLERIEFDRIFENHDITDACVDSLLVSRSAKSIQRVDVTYLPNVTANAILRLVLGFPRLLHLTWVGYNDIVPKAKQDVIVHAMRERRGEALFTHDVRYHHQ